MGIGESPADAGVAGAAPQICESSQLDSIM